MKVFGISLVRNEADIIRLTLLHHLSQGLDRILILDNGSTDGTSEILQEFSEKDQRVSWKRDDSPFDQAAITTELAREAQRQGADWILPFDADEFWSAGSVSIKAVLRCSEAGALRVPAVSFVQTRNQHESTPEALLSMTRRVETPSKPGPQARELVEDHKIGFLELTPRSKCISRATREIKVHRGNHRVTGIDGQIETCDEIVMLHAPLRSKSSLEARANRMIRLEEAGINTERGGWHIPYWVRTKREGLMDEEWAANSYEGDYLDVYGEKRRVVFDPRLRDAVAPHVAYASEGGSMIKRTLIGVKRRMWSAGIFARSLWSARKELEQTKQELGRTRQRLNQTRRKLKQAEKRTEGVRQRYRDTNQQLRNTAREYLLHKMPERSICAEIGVHEGDFSNRILSIAEPERLHMIDPWRQGEGLFGKQDASEQAIVEERYEKVKERFTEEIETGQVQIHRALSSDVVGDFPDLYFDWIYIDGNHLYEYVKQDLELYRPKVKTGGYVVGDDYGNKGYWENGVQRAVDEFVSQRSDLTLEVRSTQFIICKCSPEDVSG